jgi:hypothetical protein
MCDIAVSCLLLECDGCGFPRDKLVRTRFMLADNVGRDAEQCEVSRLLIVNSVV